MRKVFYSFIVLFVLSGCDGSDSSATTTAAVPTTGIVTLVTNDGEHREIDGIFKLYDSPTNVVYTSTKDQFRQTVTVKDLKPGTYHATFTFDASGYTLGASPDFTVEAGKTINVTYTYIPFVSLDGDWTVSTVTISDEHSVDEF
jgi:uncharacterized surface anchored protein